MSDKIVLHEIPPSPNNIKVRVAMNYKKIPFERKPIEFLTDRPPSEWNRDAILAATRQPFAPAIEHGKVKMFDSSAILRYLDANFPDTPSLFSRDYNEMRAIETWETFGKTQGAEIVSIVFNQAMSPPPDNSELKRANDLFVGVTAKIEDQLAQTKFLVRDEMSAGDVVVASYVRYGALSDEQAKSSPIAQFFHASLKMPDGREKTRAWVERVMAYDR